MTSFQRILVATDYGASSKAALETAAALASHFGAVLDNAVATIEAPVGRELDAALARVRLRLPRAEGVLREGPPSGGILEVAKERGADLVVLSTHGRHGLQRMLMGSVAEKIVRLSPVPVVTVGVK